MAFRTSGVGVDRRYVSLGDLCGSMASSAVGLAAVVIIVAGDAGLGSWLRRQRDRGGVTLRACDLRVCRVLEDHRTRAGCMLGDRDFDRERASDIQLA